MNQIIILGVILLNSVLIVQGQTKKYVEVGFLTSRYLGTSAVDKGFYNYDQVAGFNIGAGLNFFSEKKLSLDVGFDYGYRGSSYNAYTVNPSIPWPTLIDYSSTHRIHVVGLQAIGNFNISVGEKHKIIIGGGIKPSFIVGSKYSSGSALDELLKQYDNTVLFDVMLNLGYQFNQKYELSLKSNIPLITVNDYDKVFNYYGSLSFRFYF